MFGRLAVVCFGLGIAGIVGLSVVGLPGEGTGPLSPAAAEHDLFLAMLALAFISPIAGAVLKEIESVRHRKQTRTPTDLR
jgi:hypothetical protein